MKKSIKIEVAGLEFCQNGDFIRIDNKEADLTSFVWPGDTGYEALASLFRETPSDDKGVAPLPRKRAHTPEASNAAA
jgi:hypothetical protein